MNKARRNALRGVAVKLDALRAELEELRDQEQGYFDSMPENLQAQERGEAAEHAVSGIEDAIGLVDDAVSAVSGIVQ